MCATQLVREARTESPLTLCEVMARHCYCYMDQNVEMSKEGRMDAAEVKPVHKGYRRL